MHFIFADDSRNAGPTRRGMEGRTLVTVGGFIVPADDLHPLERGLDTVCARHGFQPRDEFKWSPQRASWMFDNLRGDARVQFYQAVFELASACNIRTSIVVVDTRAQPATAATTPEMDAVELFLERVSNYLGFHGSTGAIIVDQPGGGPRDERDFLTNCLEARDRGTDWVQHDQIATLLTGRSSFIRCLQLADVIASCTTARVGGEATYSPPIFDLIKTTMLTTTNDVYGGAGLKLHPDYSYQNLYYWLLGDTHAWRSGAGVPYPIFGRQYHDDDGLITN